MSCAPSTTATFLHPASPFCHLLLSPNCAPAQQLQHLSPAQGQYTCGHVLLISLDPQPPLVHRPALCLETYFPSGFPRLRGANTLGWLLLSSPPSQFPKLVLPGSVPPLRHTASLPALFHPGGSTAMPFNSRFLLQPQLFPRSPLLVFWIPQTSESKVHISRTFPETCFSVC